MSETYFDTLFNMTKDEFEQQNRELYRRSLERQLHSAYDDAEKQIIVLEKQIMAEYRKVKNDTFDVNVIVNRRASIETRRQAQAAIEGEYEKLFGEKMHE